VSNSCKGDRTASASPMSCRRPSTRRSSPRPAPNWASSPRGSPIYQPGVVADAILYSAEKAPREIVAGGAGKGMLLTQRLSPRLMDAIMVRGGFGSQMTDEPKSTADPDGLFAPMEGQDRAEGEFSEQAVPRSPLTWLDTHPSLKWSIGVVGAAVALSALRAKSGSADEG
jgi:hypothetical protein